MHLLKNKIQEAKKDYYCDACEFIKNCCEDYSCMTFTEIRAIVTYRSKDFKILKGEKYLYQFIVDVDYRCSFRAIPEIHEICLKYKIYPDD